MSNVVRPKTYAEILRFQKCLRLRRYVPEMDDELFNRVYEFIGVPGNKVYVSGGMLDFTDPHGVQVDSVKITPPVAGNTGFYSIIVLSAQDMNISVPYSGSDGGDGGGGSNNNNNNNNNNNG